MDYYLHDTMDAQVSPAVLPVSVDVFTVRFVPSSLF